MIEKDYEAKLIGLPYPKADPYGSLSMPVYHTLAYEFATAEEMEAAFCGRTAEHTYSRVTNPTVQHFEERVKAVTGAYGVTALSSGMAAISNTFLTLAWSGSNIVTSRHLFGNTYSFFVNTLSAFGVEVRFCD
ncbi:MAG: O-acetylhomoserine aminocarboxypropyltransferase/cysteine synthase, partial [Proteiniphilum sp.]|nr:O-acetylhomoserine aminocarboxypropyltransferase/cysteine synthase [Proteiniphilum sp.]